MEKCAPDGPMIAISSLGLKYAEIPFKIFFVFVFNQDFCKMYSIHVHVLKDIMKVFSHLVYNAVTF